MKETLKSISIFKYMVVFGRIMKIKPVLRKRIPLFFSFIRDYKKYRHLAPNKQIVLETADLFPRIYDKTMTTDVDPVYFLQGTWCARKIFEQKPKEHYDIGSQALMVGIISQFVPTTMIDIRPLSVSLNNLSFKKGDITALPLKDASVDSLSSICVIEHIGLGRYGDQLDQFGTEKAAAELVRVLAVGGSLYISVPVDTQTKTYFNAHRAFTRNYVLSLFQGLKLVEEKYIYGKELRDLYQPQAGFGTGLFHFKK